MRIRKTKTKAARHGRHQGLKNTLATAGIALVALGTVAGTAVGTAVPAFANTPITYVTGEIEVDNTDGQVTTYKAFRIFNANKNDDGTMSNFSWPDNNIRNAEIGRAHV